MADQRMIHRSVICSDEFIELSFEAQALYFQLTIEADSFGFVSGMKKIMRSIGVQEDALTELEKTHFVLRFESGVFVLRHWMIANGTFKNDRGYETRFPRELSMLAVDVDLTYYYPQADSKQIPDGIQADSPSTSTTSSTSSRVLNITQVIYNALQKHGINNAPAVSVSMSSSSQHTRARARADSDTDSDTDSDAAATPPDFPEPIVFRSHDGKTYTLREYMIKRSNKDWEITNATWKTVKEFREFMEDSLIRYAFDQTCTYGPEFPDQYFRAVLYDYCKSGFRTKQDAIDREKQRDEPLLPYE